MMVQTFTVGTFLTNCYVASCEKTREAIIIDPGFDYPSEAEKIFEYIDTNTLTTRYIVNTHGHTDHAVGNKAVQDRFNVPILIHEYDAHILGKLDERTSQLFDFKSAPRPANIRLHDAQALKFGKITLKTLHTPGHTRGSISLVGEKQVFSGDTLFAGSIGRTDFLESSSADMKTSLQKLARLPDDFIVYPGHGPATTIGEEKHSNPFFRWFRL